MFTSSATRRTTMRCACEDGEKSTQNLPRPNPPLDTVPAPIEAHLARLHRRLSSNGIAANNETTPSCESPAGPPDRSRVIIVSEAR